ncbi:hypothetical protein SCLCIDRAFT_34611 [Scleroderma citrinum Foug A]|uniref:Uncharacterized protein n=1 Tax=Scleroderma citrinum Foug A TaxID=1036808 RepID=A0A0C2YK41_9AGAM|nr:hypothetical protein SCLCIDRAFT_34641 [Scleroderma citrinum Foug A]KIM50142.1 hypothetical protein SCLCIDRAFT_34611 [Scleroderma citrinum Foug A]
MAGVTAVHGDDGEMLQVIIRTQGLRENLNCFDYKSGFVIKTVQIFSKSLFSTPPLTITHHDHP